MMKTRKRSSDINSVRLNNVGLFIFQAANSGKPETLESVFSTIPQQEVQKSINYVDKKGQGMTPLMVAAKRGNLRCVKLLLYHGADIHHTIRPKINVLKVGHIAKKSGHLHIEQYLKKCQSDLERFGTTRAKLELTVEEIAIHSHSSQTDRERFDVCLEKLITSCDYTLTNSSEDSDVTQPLLIRAARADNIPIVLKLIHKYKVSERTHDYDTAETLMHIACQNMSKLRFYLVKHYPDLMRKRDVNGLLPLHIACAKNDIQFVSWLFGNILAADSSEQVEVEVEESTMRVRSYSDLLSPSVNIPPNRSLQAVFPMSPPDLISPMSSLAPAGFHNTSGSTEGDGDDYDDNDGGSDPSLLMKTREQGLMRSCDGLRSNTVSVSGSSRSGSSERSFPKTKSNHGNYQNSTSSEEMVDLGITFDITSRSRTNTSPPPHYCLEPTSCVNGTTDEGPDSLPLPDSEINILLDMEGLILPHPLSIQNILDMKPFSIAVNGDSIFHILAREGFSELLNIVIKVADFLKCQVDLSVLTHREGFSSRLPLEEAIYNKSHECVQVLIHLVMVAGQMPVLLQDPHILRGAVITNNIRLVKILIENGFHKGLKPAISLAIISEFDDILRLLLYWQTQVVNSMEFSRLASVRSGRQVRGLDNGAIKWSEIQLETVQPEWLNDSSNAVSSVSRLLRLSYITADITERDFEYFKTLGRDCLYYFNYLAIRSNVKTEVSLAPITSINVSENQLRCVPPELFQMPSLVVLRLSHNDLRELPSSDKLSENIYTSNLIKLELDWNKLKELPEDMFRGLAHSLKELSVQNNRLDILPPGLWVMPKLKKIKLAHNNLDHLHYFSRSCYFNDLELSKCIVSSYMTDDSENLVCTSPNCDSTEMQQYTAYLKKLAMFYHTVCTARCPLGTPSISTIYQEMINIHLMRYINFSPGRNTDINSAEEWMPPEGSTKILKVFEDEEFESVQRCTMDIEFLDLSHNKFAEFPWDLACIAPKLQKLDLRGNAISVFDIVHSTPRYIVSLIISKNTITALNKERPHNLPCGNPLWLLCVQDEMIMDNYCQHCNHPSLDKLTNLILDCNKLSYFPIIDTPRVEYSDLSSDTSGFEVVHCDPYYPDLSILSLAHNNFMTVPKHLHHLMHLSSLTLSHNKIVELPLDMGLMNASTLLLLRLDGLYLRNVPETLLENHRPKQLLCHLKALKQKSRPYRRMKLMVVGAANQGKTSLLLNLVKRGRIKRFTEVERGVSDLPLSTVGVELGDWEYSHLGKPKVTFMTWDFGGQEEYYATHQCFLTRRSLYLLLWNVMDGEDGLRHLKPWLENIEGKAPRSPVIVIGTHTDLIPHAKRGAVLANLQAMFKRMYISNFHRMYTYPRIHEDCQFINVNSARQVDSLRDYIYEFSIQYKVKGHYTTPNEVIKPLLDEPIPESYLVLQDFIRETAEKYIQQNKKPILTKKEYIYAIRESEYSDRISEIDIDQATSFLHDSGILLHFEDSSLLDDLYFINPQWLCSMLAKLITVKENNPYQRFGFMLMDDVKKIYADCFKEFIILMQKFEVVLLVDENRVLIPSLLPQDEEGACLVFSSSIPFSVTDNESFDQLRHEPHALMYEIPHPIFTRYYLLPFIPNGLFSRLVARLMSSDIIDHLQQSLISNQMGVGDHHINDAHWKCWRNGILITWSHMEIFRIAPLSSTLAGTSKVAVVIKKDFVEYVSMLKGVEIQVALLPEEYIKKCSTLESQINISSSFPDSDKTLRYSQGKCLATWLLQQATSIVDSVFEDWYESFARKKGFDPHQENVKIANPCHKCSRDVQDALLQESRKPNSSSSSSAVSGADSSARENVCYIFTSPYAALASANGENLECPKHGYLQVCDVAPDLMFCDFLPGTVFTDQSSLVIREQLGDGGFGTVYRATLHTGGTVDTVASKQFIPDMGFLEDDPDIIAQLKAWDVYQKASLEARVMHQLSHPNILSLIGIAFHPLSLLVELAPEGDLKKAIERFKKEKVLLSRRTLRCTLIQVAEAMNYLHSRQFIYRDLKPENILVWKYPRPETQWLPGISVFVKVADYGISKQITPQGVRGVEGTRPYLPPEVILHGGREAYSTKLDVYGFGMFIYFLVSFKTPFDSGRPITSLLEEGKRPELSLKMRPRSIQLFELMCWCWSESPRHRPNFSTILEVLKEDSFTNLLASFPLIGNEEVITSSCMRSFRTRRKSSSSIYHSQVDQSLASIGAMSLVHGRLSLSSGEEHATQVWYGTESGKCGVIQFQNSGITHEIFELPQQRIKYISTIRLVLGRIWVATVGCGLFVYNPNNRVIVSQWGVEERCQIYTFFEIEEQKLVLMLTHRGMFVFNSETGAQENLVPKYEYPKEKEEMTIGVVIPQGKGKTEIWVTSQTGGSLYILNTTDFSITERVPLITSERDEARMKIRHIVTVEVRLRLVLAIANKQYIYMIDVKERRCLPEEFNCEDICSHLYHQSKRNHCCGVTALSSKDHFLYVAVRGGAILCLNCKNMEAVHVFDAYLKPARSLAMINYSKVQSKPFARLFSRTDTDKKDIFKPAAPISSLQEKTTTRPKTRHHSLSSVGNESFNLEDDTSNSVLISFGGGYKGVIKGEDYPESFVLPSEGNKTSYRSALPDKRIGHLLLWSTEMDYKTDCICPNDDCDFNEANELTRTPGMTYR